MADIGMDFGSGDRIDAPDYREVAFDDVCVKCFNGKFYITVDTGEYASMKFENVEAFNAFIRACQWVRAKVDTPL